MPLNIVDQPKSQNQIKTILAVSAGKGGVGKSSISVNLALSLKKRGFKVGLLDADIYGPSTLQMLPSGIEPSENQNDETRILPGMSLGIPFISIAQFKREASIVRAPIANTIIDKFLNQVDWGELDFLVIDFPPGTGDIQLTLMQKGMISLALMVTTPQIVSLLDVRKAIQMFQKMKIPVCGVVENMSFFFDVESSKTFTPFGKGGGEDLSKEFDIPLLGQIPLDPLISEVGDCGESLFERNPDSPGAQAIDALCENFLKESSKFQPPDVQVRQSDPRTLQVKFLDDEWKNLEAATIQKNCLCARCSEKEEKKLDQNISILEFSLIGRYALRVNFSRGCSQGIYPFSLIKKLI